MVFLGSCSLNALPDNSSTATLNEPNFKEYVHSLKNKETFGCFCAPKPCHADVIIEYLETL